MRDTPPRHRTAAELAAGLPGALVSPRDAGTVGLIVRRPAPSRREVVPSACLDERYGLIGDHWKTGKADTAAQIAIMNLRVAALLAVDPTRIPLAGDQFFLDLDLSAEALPVGARLAVGETALLEVTAKPHTGCRSFVAWFGEAANALVNSPAGLALRLRGANCRILRGGVVHTGDPIRRVDRG